MSRLQLVELEDLPWWPVVLRDLATDYLHFMETKFALHRPVVPLLSAALRETGARRLVDLCSGGAGPVPPILADLKAEGLDVQAVLTDLYPNQGAFARVALASGGAISFESAPVDAASVPPRLMGFRTMFNAFHHFAPESARAVLRDAGLAGQPIGIFEIPERALRTIIPIFFAPVFVLVATLWIRPFTFRRFLFTYLVPLVPFNCWWDGVVSMLRAYTAEELLALGRAAWPAYQWRAGTVPIGATPGVMTYLIGRE